MKKKNKKLILSSRHYLNNANTGKLLILKEFIQEYRRVANLYLDYIWEHGLKLFIQNKYYHFDTKTNLDCPQMLCNPPIDDALQLKTTLTGRAKKCCLAQVLSIIRGVIQKQKQRQFIVNQQRAKHSKIHYKLRQNLRKFKPKKPDISNVNPELNSVCMDYQEEDDRHFNTWIQLHSFTNTQRNIAINLPIHYHKHSNQLKSQGKRLNSFLVTDKYIDIRWEMRSKNNKGTKTVGGDQGITDILVLSDGQVTPKTCKHGHSMESILDTMSRKKSGSKAMKKCQEHRKNFINWSINRLNFDHIKQLNYEGIKYIRYGRSVGKKLSHWAYTLINEQVEKRCFLEEVLLRYDSSTYMSQRCHQCGLVLKSSRRGKLYSCKNCGYIGDADYNSSCNHQQELHAIPSGLRRLNLNRSGFYWKQDGFYNLAGDAITVHLSKEAG